MKFMTLKYRKTIMFLIILLFLIAGLLDLAFEGLVYQLLPTSIQSYVNRILS
ncbi:hypothetical protein [Bacillus pinisoli]|uniref:hypothetical protein n=1 Tax=Bacillus pinisoli TaxID=2901866 RepID=UPI001FF55053|nr:hypothetical protein [Bacillus pinisoli]